VNSAALRTYTDLRLAQGRMILAFSGWMDGGDVSIGTVDWLSSRLKAQTVADIDPEGFFLCHFPGPMEINTLLRPQVRVLGGLVQDFEPIASTFFAHPAQSLALFRGREPNLRWNDFADCIFAFANAAGITRLYFVGSFGGTVPHTRTPRLWSSVSDPALKPELETHGVRFSDYEGPASFATLLLHQAAAHGVQMVSLVAEIPAYIQGTNPTCIEAVVRTLAAILKLNVPLSEFRSLSPTWEEKVSEALDQKPDLTKYIHKLEEDYDNEVFDTQMGDLKDWLEQQGIRVD
jgi:hypothetical protein